MTWLQRTLLTVFNLPTKWLVKTKSIPADLEKELGIDKSRPIVYLLRTHSITDLLSLKMSAKSLGLPSPVEPIKVAGKEVPSALFLQEPQSLFSRKIKGTDIDAEMAKLLDLHRDNKDIDFQIVPVSVFWGRAPGRSKPGFSDLLADRASPSWLRKLFIVLFLGRDNFVCYSRGVSSRYVADLHGTDTNVAHKLIRVAGTHFHRRRQALTGPTTLERQELYNAILGSASVKQAMSEEAKGKKSSPEKAKVDARKYIDEIAADYKEGLIRIGDRLLTRIWNKIYNGIDVQHAAKVRKLAENGHEIVYVPCHRSHMDYLLLTYVIYHEGLVTPHIAAGINLNFWPVGGIFRRGGAFFLRRSFGGNKLYTAVFREYLELLFNKGYSVKYYPEGGRSRTGRLLPPKTGMLAMTVQAVAKGVNRPVSIVPVYIGYEHVMEVASYLKELEGRSKKKESFLQVFSAVRKLKNYGYGFLNFGDPITLTNYLDDKVPDWRQTMDANPEKKPSWLTPTVNDLANQVMLRINQSAAVSGMSLCSLCLLSAKKHAMAEDELITAIEDYLGMLTDAPYSSQFSLPKVGAEKLVRNTLRLNKIQESKDSFGRILSLGHHYAVALTYYRNNILHLFAIPGLIAAVIFHHKGLSKQTVLSKVAQLYPLLKRELFIYMTDEQAQEYAEKVIDSMLSRGMLVESNGLLQAADPTSKHFYSFWLLQSSIQETLHRYAVVLTILQKEEQISRGDLERRSRAFAERLSALQGINSPEFYDKNVLATFIGALRENHMLDAGDEGQLKHSPHSKALLDEIEVLIAPEIAQRLQQIQKSA